MRPVNRLPVYASVHSLSEDLNLQVYNRCVGTRYCGNNCPYQVRAFNWRDYTDERVHPELVTLHNQLNPDVTVRRRGVMEKCTFCIQRIHKAEDKAKSEGRDCRMANLRLPAHRLVPPMRSPSVAWTIRNRGQPNCCLRIPAVAVMRWRKFEPCRVLPI